MDRAVRLPSPPSALDDLDRTHDGAPPRDATRLAMAGDIARLQTLAQAAALALHSRLAAEARLGAARRRTALPAGRATADLWLSRLSATLAHHRHAACGVMEGGF